MPRKPAPEEGVSSLVAPAGALLAVALPHAVFSLASPDALYEVKGLAQALSAAAVLAGLAFLRAAPPGPSPRELSPRLSRGAAFVLWLLVALSTAAGLLRGLDPLVAVSVLAPVGLFLWGASPAGSSAADRLLVVVAGAGALTGGLAALQRFGGVLRLPLDVPEERFWASALLGNPGDVAASLVFPALVLWARLDGFARASLRQRSLVVLGSLCVVAGFAATGAAAPLVAAAAGALVHAALGPSRRLPRLGIAAVLVAVALGASGTGRRLVVKVVQAARGEVSASLTQRDIGYLAAAEMVRARPVLGVGPGCYSSAFVPARLAAEERVRRRLVHASLSSHFENAHSDPLTLAAECGLPAAASATVGLLALAVGLLRAARRRDGAGAGESAPDLLLALLAALLVLGLASFPMRIPSVSGPAAFVLGLAWRCTGASGAIRPGTTPRRGLLLGAALLLATAAAVRFGAVALQTSGERAVRVAPMAPPELRSELLQKAEQRLSLSIALRPRHATSRLALGAAYGLAGRLPEAVREMERSLRLEERAETVVGLGRLLSAREERRAAHALFVRAVWTLPALLSAVPDAADPESVQRDVARYEAGLATGGPSPPLPETLEPALGFRPRSP